MRFRPFRIAFALLLVSTAARADSFYIDKNKYEGTVEGLRDGRLVVTIKGVQHVMELSDITVINLDEYPKFVDAETARIDDAKKSAALYKQLIPALNKPELKLLAEWRAIEPTDKDGRWLEAVTLFLDVYQNSPVDAVWKGRPVHMPAAASSMLAESADKIAGAIKTAKTDDARKNLKTFLLDIYTKAGDTQSAQRIAHEIATGIVEEAPQSNSASDPNAVLNAAVAQVENDIKAKNFSGAIKQADSLLEGRDGGAAASAEVAVQLFALKAQAYEESNQPEAAAAAWLRIPAHYGSSPAVPAALLHAAQLEAKLNHPDAAKALYREILDKYPTSREAVIARSAQ